MLADERLGRDGDAGQAGDLIAGGDVHGHVADGRAPGVGGVQGDAAHRHPVGGAQQHHPLDLALALGEQPVGGAGHIAGIDVPGMGCDHRLRRHFHRRGPGQAGVDAGGQLIRVGRIEHPGNAGGVDVGAHRKTVRAIG